MCITENEIFVSSGACDDLGDILELFDRDNTVMVIEPAYPEYVDTNILAGRKIIHLASGKRKRLLPEPSKRRKQIFFIFVLLITLLALYTVVEGCRHGSILLMRSERLSCLMLHMRSLLRKKMYHTASTELDGADRCANEICSLSKTAGFTGTLS